MMHITYLGHAGFCVESQSAIIIMDPWLSPDGAFDCSWFQFPSNHHLAEWVQAKLAYNNIQKFIYISHEHKDHFDIRFLGSLQTDDFTFVIPRFRRNALFEEVSSLPCKGVIACEDGQKVEIPGGYLRLFVEDSELNRDSAILVRIEDRTFLNINDCKLHDRIPSISLENNINIFAAQYSGAVWHPTCYDYPRDEYEKISLKKRMAKFTTVGRSIEILRPDFYLPSAGPACFLDPDLIHLNFEPMNIFPRPADFIRFLELRRKPGCETRWPEIMPGDTLDVERGEFIKRADERVSEENLREYIAEYASRTVPYFEDLKAGYRKLNIGKLFEHLRQELLHKLEGLTLHERIRVNLYLGLTDHPAKYLRVDFPKKQVTLVGEIEEESYYSIRMPSWQIARVLDGKLTWADFCLTFRTRLNREPDVYQTLLQGFLSLEAEDVNWFCQKLLDFEDNEARIVVNANGLKYAVRRVCPHQGADLTHAWVEDDRYLVCPRHGWRFDLWHGGTCIMNNNTINAVCLEEE